MIIKRLEISINQDPYDLSHLDVIEKITFEILQKMYENIDREMMEV